MRELKSRTIPLSSFLVFFSTVTASPSLPILCGAGLVKDRGMQGLALEQDVVRLQDVLAHLLHEGFWPTVRHHAPEPGHELHDYCLAVEIEVLDALFGPVDDVRLHLAAHAVKRGVGANGDGRRPARPCLVYEPARVDAVRRNQAARITGKVGGGEAEVAAARGPVDHLAPHPVSAAQDRAGGADVSLP